MKISSLLIGLALSAFALCAPALAAAPGGGGGGGAPTKDIIFWGKTPLGIETVVSTQPKYGPALASNETGVIRPAGDDIDFIVA